MKKLIALLLLLVLVITCTAGCTKKQNDAEDDSAEVSGITLDSEIVTESGETTGTGSFADSSENAETALPSESNYTDTNEVAESGGNTGSVESSSGTVTSGSGGGSSDTSSVADSSKETESSAVKEGPGGIELPYDYFD